MERQALIDLLTEVEPALAKNTLIQVLNHFWFRGKSLMAFDGNMAISVGCPTEFTGAVPQTFLSLLKTLKAAELEFMAEEGVLNVKAASSKLKLTMMPPDDYIFKMPKAQTTDPMPIDAGRFLQAMDACLRSIGNDTSQSDLLGITLIPDDKRLQLFSTDRATLSHGSCALKGPVDFERVILRTDFCKQLLRIAEGAKEIRLEITDEYALLKHEGVTLFGYAVPIDNPSDFAGLLKQQLSPTMKQCMVSCEAPKLRSMLERACIITDASVDKTKTAVTVKDSKMHFVSKSERGEATDTMLLEEQHPDVTAHIDPRRMLEGLDSFNRMIITGDCVAMTSSAKERDDLVYLVSASRS